MRLRRRHTAGLIAALAAFAAAPPAAPAAPYRDLGDPSGPLTHVSAAADLSCQAQHIGDSAFQFAPAASAPADCGTLVAVDGQVFGPGFRGQAAYATVSQTPQGKDAVATVADLPGTGLQIVQRDSYLPGQDAYRTDVTVRNTGAAALSIVLYRAGDCHLQGSGSGYGFAGSPDGSVGCSAQPNNAPLDRVIQWVPISPGNNWMQGSAAAVWGRVGAGQPFANECLQCMSASDAAAGISWALSIAPGASETRSHWTVFSPTGRMGPPPPVPQPPVEPVATTVQGTTITFTGPAGCVTPPARYRLRVTSMRKKRISKDRFGWVRRVKILRAEFFVDGERRLTDKRAAFKALLTSAGAAPGEHKLTARVLLQPLRQKGRQRLVGRKFRRTLTSAVHVCG